MKACVYNSYGPPEVLQIKEVKQAIPLSNEVLIKVYASTVSAATIWIRRGAYPGSRLFTFIIRLQYGFTKPKKSILGFEFSGVVASVGKDVTLFKVGDEVYGTTTGLKHGAYAEYVCVPQRWKCGVIAHKPPSLTFEAAAALPVGGMTALQLLLKANIQLGYKVLIYGASGCVGTYGVQIA